MLLLSLILCLLFVKVESHDLPGTPYFQRIEDFVRYVNQFRKDLTNL